MSHDYHVKRFTYLFSVNHCLSCLHHKRAWKWPFAWGSIEANTRFDFCFCYFGKPLRPPPPSLCIFLSTRKFSFWLPAMVPMPENIHSLKLLEQLGSSSLHYVYRGSTYLSFFLSKVTHLRVLEDYSSNGKRQTSSASYLISLFLLSGEIIYLLVY